MRSFFLFIFILNFVFTFALEPNSTTVRVKNVDLNGNLGLTFAEFSMRFPEPIYFQFPAPCPAGRCPIERQQAAIDADPCSYMPCDFTLKGADCGKARLPECEPLCASKRESFCPPIQDWIILELNVESEPIYLSNRVSDYSLRVNFDQICHALVFQVFYVYGSGPALIYHVDTIDPNLDYNCQNAVPPEGSNVICPSFLQCYRYGTYFLKLRNWEPNAIFTVKVSALPIEEGPQRLQSLPDAPLVAYPDPDFPYHIPLQWSVPFTYEFPPTGIAVPFLLSSYYCGFVTIQVNMDKFDNTVILKEAYELFISVDPSNPIPSSLTSDMIFLTMVFSKIYICSDDPSQPAKLFMLLVRGNGAAFAVPGTITITVDYERPGLIPLAPPQKSGDFGSWSDYTAWPSDNWYAFGEGALQIDCPGYPRFYCTAGCEKFGCCQNTWPAFPTGPSLQPLYPVPYILRFLNQDIIFNDFAYFNKYLNPYVMGVTVILEQNFGGSIQYGPLGPDWAEILPLCTLSPGQSGMGTLDGRWISGSYQPTFIDQAPCDYQTFAEISADMDSIFSSFNNVTGRPLSLRYQADILTSLDAWIDCTNFVSQDLLEDSILHLVAQNTKECPEFHADDPCCNPSLAWNQCCIPRTIEFDITLPSNISSDMDSICPLPHCSTPLLQSFIQGSLVETVGSCDPGILASPSQITTESVSVFSRCMFAHFGNDFLGITCYDDSDCPNTAGSRCDIISHRCLGNASLITDAFVDCVTNNISIPARLSLIERQGWIDSVDTTSLTRLIVDTYSSEYCIHADYPIMGTLYRPYFKTFTAFPGCPVGNFIALSNSITPPSWQSARQITGGNCAYDFSIVRPNVDENVCLSAENYCNWNPSITDEQTCLNGDNFCAVCETLTSCIVLPDQDCGTVCVLANGQVIPGLTQEQCQNRLSCTDPAFSDQTNCENSGMCEDTEQIAYSLDSTLWAGSHSRTGFCTFPMAPYDTPDCNYLYPGSFPSSFGCVRFGQCVAIGFVLTCHVDYDNATSCQTAGGVWYPTPTTRDECESPVLCDVPRYTGTRTSVWESNYHYLSEFVSAESCTSCGGVMRPINRWTANRWIGGQIRTASFHSPSMIQPYRFETSLDFAAFSRINIEAAESSTRFQTLNALQCSYGNEKAQVEALACNCLDHLNRDVCFRSHSETPFGRGRFCPFTENKVISPPFTLESTDRTLDASVINKCITVQLDKLPSQSFDIPEVVPVTISFKRRKERPFTPGSYETVYNSQHALVGAVIGDGLKISFESQSDASKVTELFLCQTLPLSITPNLAQYPVYDFGEVTSVDDVVVVTPLHVETNYSAAQNQVCAYLHLPHHVHVKYAPIVRLANDEAKAGTTFTSGQKACLYTIASLFVIAICIWIILFSDTIRQGAFKLSLPTNVVWACSLWIFLQRSIYIYLVAANVLNQPNSHQLVDYFMMDFPICVYLIANFQIGVSFAFLYFQPGEDAKRFWIIFTIGSFFIVMLFIGVLLAYRYEVLDVAGLSGPVLCPIYTDNTNTARTIRLIYQSIILFVSVCIGLGEVVMGLSVYRRVSAIKDSTRLLALCFVASVGIIADTIAFLVYYIIDDPHPYFSIVLIFTEIIPLLYLIFHVRSSALRHAGPSPQHTPTLGQYASQHPPSAATSSTTRNSI